MEKIQKVEYKCFEESCLSSDSGESIVDGYLQLYTDGGCYNNGKENAYGAVGIYFGRGSKLNTSVMLEGKVTNNIAEIKAAYLGLQKAYENGEITNLCCILLFTHIYSFVVSFEEAWEDVIQILPFIVFFPVCYQLDLVLESCNIWYDNRGLALKIEKLSAFWFSDDLKGYGSLEKVKLFTDSHYVVMCCSHWLKGWKKNNWKKANGRPVLNQEELEYLDEAISKMDDVQMNF
ncbi:Ribonuclease H [Armadillidium vulgare]|nr:Ribonuclease H [Armadillidium vulgare]